MIVFWLKAFASIAVMLTWAIGSVCLLIEGAHRGRIVEVTIGAIGILAAMATIVTLLAYDGAPS